MPGKRCHQSAEIGHPSIRGNASGPCSIATGDAAAARPQRLVPLRSGIFVSRFRLAGRQIFRRKILPNRAADADISGVAEPAALLRARRRFFLRCAAAFLRFRRGALFLRARALRAGGFSLFARRGFDSESLRLPSDSRASVLVAARQIMAETASANLIILIPCKNPRRERGGRCSRAQDRAAECLRGDPLDDPIRVALARIAEAIMHAVRATLPELDRVRV